MKQLAFLEILANKDNLDGPWAFEHILQVIHEVYEKPSKKALKKEKHEENFSLEISKIGNRIRFFITCPFQYKDFLKNQIYAHYSNIEIHEIKDYLEWVPTSKVQIWVMKLAKHYVYPIKTFLELQEQGTKNQIDPYSSITSALSRTGKYTLNTFQIVFHPIPDKNWKVGIEEIIKILSSHHSDFYKKLLLSKKFQLLTKIIKYTLMPFYWWVLFLKLLAWKWIGWHDDHDHGHDDHWDHGGHSEHGDHSEGDLKANFLSKISHLGYNVSINLFHASENEHEGRVAIKELASTLSVYSLFGNNSFKLLQISNNIDLIRKVKNRKTTEKIVLNTQELSGLVHIPTSYVKTPSINWLSARAFEPPFNLPIIDPDLKDETTPETQYTPIGKTNFRWTDMSFWIGPDDRRRHMYIIGKTGMWKSTLLENMIIDDMRKGRWLALVDPHGDLAEAVIWFIPKNRTNHTIIFDPSDKEWPIAFNMLENIEPEHRSLVASGLIWIFKKIFWESWGPRLEHILRNTIMALLEYPNTTIISIPLMLTSETYRQKVVAKISDHVVKNFWENEFAKLTPQQRTEAINPILNKVGQFLSSPILRNVLGQPKNSFSLRWAMDNKKIIIVNLSKWLIGEDASSLLGAMIITKFQLEAMSRANIKENERKDFYLYVDEFQNFATDSFATILSEARKYKLNLVMANQYIDQMTETVRGAVFWNVWSLLSFQVGYHDAAILKEAFWGGIVEEDLTNIKKYSIYLKQLIDGMPSPIFSADTFAPNKKDDEEFKTRYDKILQVSREKYCKPRASVVEKINKLLIEVEWAEKKLEQFRVEQKKKKEEDKKK